MVVEAVGAVPIGFGAPEARCFGWFHAAGVPGRRAGIVLCRPVGNEGNSTLEGVTRLAEGLSSAGFCVMRFDYHGTGDAPGSYDDPDRVRVWLECLKSAIQEVQRLGGVTRVSLLGIRLGATLALQTAVDMGGVDGVVLWAPCSSGRAFARELKVATFSAGLDEGAGAGDIEAFGSLYTAETLKDLGALDSLKLPRAPAPRALVIGRDDLPGEGPLPAALRKLGVDVVYRDLPGYAAMIVEPHEEEVPAATLDVIEDFFCDVHPITSGAEKSPPPSIAPHSPVAHMNGVCETPIFFGPDRKLFGFLTEPSPPRPGSAGRERAVLLYLNIATNYHVGPNRMYVEMARALAARGYSSLRFDFSGIGDSRVPGSAYSMYSKHSLGDVGAAIDWLARHGFDRFYVVGLCSGAYVAFQSALADPRITGQILMNPRRLVWKETDTLQSVMAQKNFKSTRFYRQAMFDPKTYARLLRGEIDTAGIANRMRLLVEARVRRLWSRVTANGAHEEDVLLDIRRLCERGTESIFVVGAEDDGLDYVEFHLGKKGRNLRDARNFRMFFVQGTDHTFSRASAQRQVIEYVGESLDATFRS
jgi:alpha-beta hydrolase superfamily lysophospholipase